MLLILGCICLTALMYLTLRGGLVGERGMTVVGMDVQGLGLGFLAFAAAAWYFGPLYGVAIVLSVMIHEFGHVAAFRIAGHSDARFRLIPLMGGVAISDTPPETQADDFFITIMGPAICLVPMIMAYALMGPVAMISYTAYEFLWIFAITTGALNFFNLLPFWPLDGGRCVRIITETYLPRAAAHVTIAMSAGFAAIAVAMQSMALTFFAVMGATSLFTWSATHAHRKALTGWQGLTAIGAYIFTLLAHLVGGLPFILYLL